MSRTASFTKTELERSYPELAAAFQEIIERPDKDSKKKFASMRKNYSGNYFHTGTEELRRVRLDKIIETVEADGRYKLHIQIQDKQKPKK
jgi:hypothetical protein